jgi:hypothetical protein
VLAGEATISWLTEETFEEPSVGNCDPEEGAMLEPKRTDTRARYSAGVNRVFITGNSFVW